MPKESRALWPKPCGIETEFVTIIEKSGARSGYAFMREYGAAFVRPKDKRLSWDSTERLRESRFIDDEDSSHHDYLRDADWMADRNFFLHTGARLYLDGGQVELSTPLCLSPRMLLTWNRAGYLLLDNACKTLKERGHDFKIFRNNVALDGEINRDRDPGQKHQRTTVGCHLNLACRFDLPESLVREVLGTFLILGQIFWGAGKVGCDYENEEVEFQISQRSDWFYMFEGPHTMGRRPWFNTRNVPYGRHRRLHIIPPDSNMLELPEYLKIALMTIIVMMIEDEAIDKKFSLLDPVREGHRISWGTDLKTRVTLFREKKSVWVLDCLHEILDISWNYLEKYHPKAAELKLAVIHAGLIIETLKAGKREDVIGMLDWITKENFIKERLARKNKGWESAYAANLDIHYHHNASDGLFHEIILPRLEAEGRKALTLTTDKEIAFAQTSPPPSRSHWIYAIYEKFRDRVTSSDFWYRISFAVDECTNITFRLPDQTMLWNPELAARLLSLPFPEFIEAAKIELGAKTEGHEERPDIPRQSLSERTCDFPTLTLGGDPDTYGEFRFI